MTLRRVHHGLVALLIGLFLAFQISASAHTTTFGDAPHEHDGISCVITTLAEIDQDILPVEPEVLAEPSPIVLVWHETFTSTSATTSQTRAPPPRAPPLLIQ